MAEAGAQGGKEGTSPSEFGKNQRFFWTLVCERYYATVLARRFPPRRGDGGSLCAMRREHRRPPFYGLAVRSGWRRSAIGKFQFGVSLAAFVFRQVLGRLLEGSWQVLGRFSAGSRRVLGLFSALRFVLGPWRPKMGANITINETLGDQKWSPYQ